MIKAGKIRNSKYIDKTIHNRWRTVQIDSASNEDGKKSLLSKKGNRKESIEKHVVKQ